MSGRPLVSVITATYNALEGLKETVASVSSQTFDHYEHVVIDGASTDGTQEWLTTQPTLRWLSESDEGIADALNKGIEMAEGEWILVLQSQDKFLSSRSLDEAVGHLSPDVDVVCFDVAFSTEAGIRRLTTSGLSFRLNWKPFPHQGAFTRTELFNRIGGFDTSYRISMDYEFFMRAYRTGARSHVEHRMVTLMPATGVSSQRDWGTVSRRFREERAVHLRYCRSNSLRVLYMAYWPIYLLYRRIRAVVSRSDERVVVPSA